ncbi:hypothetical protein BGX30_002510 [Mortierella sp. GBA39]|nr:hypothetical protein BGX30_002510 [Mortierella sp. GBA39]
MDPSELTSLKEQVADLETALLSDPNNEDLLTCKTELLELISLTETLLQQEQQLADDLPALAAPVETTPVTQQANGGGVSATSSPYRTTSTASGSGASTPNTSTTASTSTAAPATKGSNQPIYQPPAQTRLWAVGDRCRALYAEDGKYYEATILAVADGQQAYSVQYTGYANSPPVTLEPENLKPIYDPKKHQQHTPAAGDDSEEVKAGQKRGPDAGVSVGSGAGAGGGMKKKKKDAGPSEQVQKQMAWQNFAKGKSSVKKGKASGGVVGLKKSIFATPDNPEGKVGVVGSGKGMTQFQQRGKHLYGNTDSL